jgi:hypothetical protein
VDWLDILAFGERHPAINTVSQLVETLHLRHTLMPTLRRLRSVLKIVDMLLDVQWRLEAERWTLKYNLEAAIG